MPKKLMKRLIQQLLNNLRISKKLSANGLPLLLLLILFPVILLMGFGLLALYQMGYLLHFTLLLTGSSLVYVALLYSIRRSIQPQADKQTAPLVQASPDWSEFDLQVWHGLNQTLDSQLQPDDSWELLREHALALISATANQYRPGKAEGELAFTLPELLAMTEEVSRRYHRIVLEHLPFAEQIQLSQIKQIYRHRDKTAQIEKIWQVYRTYRLFTPTGVIAELRSQLTGHLFNEVKAELALRLKKAFLQEVVSVAIDLYSGRFQEATPPPPAVLASDTQPPLRICLVGQINAGKSTLVNLLTNAPQAEVDLLPATDETQVYALKIEGLPLMHLIDLPGLDGSSDRSALAVREATQSDLVIWLLKANQPARQIDLALKAQLDDFYAAPDKRSRKRPPLLALLTQIDRLSAEQNKAAETWLQEALDYNQSLLQPDQLIPLSTAPNQPSAGIEQLLAQLDQLYPAAHQAQLNRLRLDKTPGSMRKEATRLYRMGRSLLKRLKKTS